MTDEERAFFRRLIEEGIPFNAFLGLKVLHLEPGDCRLLLPFRSEFVGDARRGALHGGVISTLIDVCGGFTVWSRGHVDDRVATIDLRVDYLMPAVDGDIVAHGRLRLLGNRVGNAQVEVFSREHPDRLLAEGKGVYNIRRRR
ncbi:MAG: PaaI family thioesterase [Deltaproteobacteria bacterium]|nr:PaaI family thioesterase [Deltaproteobacteria bacterium]